MSSHIRFRFFLSFFVVVFSLYALPVQAGMLEFFFPSLKQDVPGPEDTLRAPFATAPAAEEGEEQLPVNAIPLTKPHRVTAEITQWVMNAAAEVMNFDADDYRTGLKATEILFDAPGRGQYVRFLQDKNITKVLASKKFQVRSYVEDTPILLNEGSLNGRYRWLYQVPVVISYLDINVTGYEGTEPLNHRAMINVQVGRSVESRDPQGILIEQWSGKVEPFAQKK